MPRRFDLERFTNEWHTPRTIDHQSSPTRQAAIKKLRDRFPNAAWVSYSPAEATGAIEGTRIAFGKPMREVLSFAGGGQVKAKVIVSLDRVLACLNPSTQKLQPSVAVSTANRILFMVRTEPVP